jgi:hypothetical protein
VIANCPSCGTHYKHEPPRLKVRARCGRCDTALDLSRLRPYRIAPAGLPTREDVRRAKAHLPIGLDHPALATTIARNVARPATLDSPARPADIWDDQDPLPPIPEMTLRGAFESSVPPVTEAEILAGADDEPYDDDVQPRLILEAPSRPEGGAATFVLWVATGAIAGTGASWTAGGTTTTGLAAGTVLGVLAGWGWLRWMSPR